MSRSWFTEVKSHTSVEVSFYTGLIMLEFFLSRDSGNGVQSTLNPSL